MDKKHKKKRDLNSSMKVTKKGYRKWIEINTKNYLGKKK